MNRSVQTAPEPRRRQRNRLYVWGIVPSLLLLAFAAKVIVMLAAQSSGESAYAADEFDTARKEFASNKTLNVIESWRAPFNEGDARFGLADHEGAIEEFETALDSAPEERECMIRVNLALSHEAKGDASASDQEMLEAFAAWRTGREVLAAGECETEDARSTDARLQEKLEEHDADEDSGKDEKEDPEKEEPDTELEKKRKQLERRNGEGMDKRKDYRELEDYPFQADPPEQQW